MNTLCRRSLVASAALLAFAAAMPAFAVATVGQKAPDFTLQDTSGKAV